MVKPPEAAPSPTEEKEIGEIVFDESEPLRQTENEAVKNLTEEYVKPVELSEDSKKTADEFLMQSAKEELKDFAQKWLSKPDNAKKLESSGVLPENASEDYKISLVLSDPKIRAEMRTGYIEWGKELDKIEVLRADLAKEKLPPETPFLLLNQLQYIAAGMSVRIMGLRAEEKNGNESAGIEADQLQKQFDKLFLARKEIAEKVLRQDLTEKCTKEVSENIQPKDEYVKANFAPELPKATLKRNQELLNREWQEFEKLSDTAKLKYQADAGFKMGTQADFENAIQIMAKKNGISGDAFYGMLAEGYKPYEIKSRATFWPITRIFTLSFSVTEVPRRNGESHFTTGKNHKELEEFGRLCAKRHNDSLALNTQANLEKGWDQNFEDAKRTSMEDEIYKLAATPYTAEGGIEKMYKEAQERIVAESIKKIAEKNQASGEQIKTMEKGIAENKRQINIVDVIKDAYFCKGELEDIWDDSNWEDKDECFAKIKKYFKNQLGYSLDAKAFKKISETRYRKIWETKTGLFGFLLELMQNVKEPKKSKKKKNP